MLANNSNNSDQRLYQKMLQADTSHSSFRESAKQALAATKHYDGSLRIHTPFQDEQSKKVQNLKHQLTKLSSTSNYKRCQSGLNDSSTNSVTAATSYAQPHGSGITGSGVFQYRPNSNISNFLNDGGANNNTGMKQYYGTELTRFSQNSYSKDLSPLRVSNLNQKSSANNANNNNTRASGGANATRQYEQKHVMTQSAVQHARRHSGLQSGYSPVYQSNAVTRNPKFEMEYQNKRNSAANRGDNQRQNSTGSLYCSGSRRGHSQRSLRTNQSSPERLVNIVCPPSKGSKNKRQARVTGGESRSKTRPQSDMRHQIYNSFGVNSEQQSRRKNISKQMKAFADQQGFMYNSFQSKNRDNKSQQRHCLANLMKNRAMISTPLKSRQSATSLSQTRSKSKQKSRSCSRLGQNARLSRQDSAPGLSAKRSSKKLQQKAFMSKWVKSGSQNRLSKKRSASNKSLRSKSGHSTSRSHNSNAKGDPSDVMKREQRRVTKYLIHQGRDSSLKKSMDFDSIVTDKQESWPQSTKMQTKAASGQVTGKFQSLNEQMISQMMTNQQNQQQQQHQSKKAQQVAFADSSLRTEDDYCETLTASSEESPLRPAKRVQRAAQLTTKAYLDEVTQRVDKVNNQHGEQSIREFGPRKLKAAYQGINERQGARLQCLKQQMKESLVETHLLQSKLQSSAGDDHHNLNRSMKHRGQGVSQFNSLVLEFSNNLENMATEMIEATEKKRKNMRMHGMLNEMEQTRRARSRSGSKSCPISARKRKSPRSGSKRKSRKSTPKSARSKSSGKKLKKSKGRKRSKSTTKKLKKRSKSKSLKRSRSLSKSVKSARSGRSGLSVGGRSATSGASSRGRSRSRKKIKSVKRNIFKQTNGFRDVSNGSFGPLMRKPSRSKSKKSRKVSRSKSKSKSGVRKRSLSTKAFSRARELAKKCESLVKTRFNVVNKNNTQVPKSRKRSISLNKKKGQQPSKSRSNSKGKKMVKKSTKSGKASRSRSKSARKRSERKGSKSPAFFDKSVTPKIEPQLTPCMTPLHNILRNSMGDPEFTDMRSRMNTRFGSSTAQQQGNKKVKICSRRLQDISRLTSSDSDSSLDSERSMSHERYMKRQQAHLSPWQRACIRKQMPKKFR